MSGETDTESPCSLSKEALAARKRRNIWLGLALAGFVIIVLLITMVRLANGIPERM